MGRSKRIIDNNNKYKFLEKYCKKKIIICNHIEGKDCWTITKMKPIQLILFFSRGELEDLEKREMQ